MVCHIYKSDCFGSSRLMLQAKWDEQSVFIHKTGVLDGEIHEVDGKKIISQKLLWKNIISVLRCEEVNSMVFHAQSSILYLLACYVYLVVWGCGRKVLLVYDIHDLNEYVSRCGVNKYFDYIYYRYNVFLLLEYFVLHVLHIKSMTVSKGLSRIISKRYRCDRPKIVRSAILPDAMPVRQNNQNNKCRAVYFGTRNHLPISLIPELIKYDISVDFYGRDVRKGEVLRGLPREKENLFRFYGAYIPENLDFLNAYDLLILFKPEKVSINYRYALPNKMYQSLAHGLSILVSDNFIEMKYLLRCISGAVVVFKDGDDLPSVLTRVRQNKDEYVRAAWQFVVQLHNEARYNYQEMVFQSNF